jgi:hypothetical protein
MALIFAPWRAFRMPAIGARGERRHLGRPETQADLTSRQIEAVFSVGFSGIGGSTGSAPMEMLAEISGKRAALCHLHVAFAQVEQRHDRCRGHALAAARRVVVGGGIKSVEIHPPPRSSRAWQSSR